MASTNPARGMRDFLPADVRKREYVIGIIKSVYESYGFEPLETPAVENIDTLMGKYGDEGNQLIFKILKRGEKLLESVQGPKSKVQGSGSQTLDIGHGTLDSLSDLALRYDLTVPLARVVANNKNDLPKFFKRYQIQPVWRADRPARGRFREFYQCDVDCIGSESKLVEVELLAAVAHILTRLKFDNFIIRVNHRSILAGLLNAFGVETHKHNEALIALDKLDKIGPDGVEKEMRTAGFKESTKLLGLLNYFNEDVPALSHRTKLGLAELISYLEMLERPEGMIPLNSAVVNKIFRENTNAFKGNKDALLILRNVKIIEGLTSLFLTDKTAITAVQELSFLWTQLNSFGLLPHFRIDPSLARSLSYYTGTIMEINVPDLAGSLGGGGRYDGLIGMFGKEQIPACGFSLGLERILVVMEERGMFPPEIADSTPADVMVTIWNEETVTESLKLAGELRVNSLRVTVYPEADKLGKQLKYADTINVPWVCVLGESEIAGGTVMLKNMKSGEQQPYPRGEVASKITR